VLCLRVVVGRIGNGGGAALVFLDDARRWFKDMVEGRLLIIAELAAVAFVVTGVRAQSSMTESLRELRVPTLLIEEAKEGTSSVDADIEE
jgi:hypothetical protein